MTSGWSAKAILVVLVAVVVSPNVSRSVVSSAMCESVYCSMGCGLTMRSRIRCEQFVLIGVLLLVDWFMVFFGLCMHAWFWFMHWCVLSMC